MLFIHIIICSAWKKSVFISFHFTVKIHVYLVYDVEIAIDRR